MRANENGKMGIIYDLFPPLVANQWKSVQPYSLWTLKPGGLGMPPHGSGGGDGAGPRQGCAEGRERERGGGSLTAKVKPWIKMYREQKKSGEVKMQAAIWFFL